MFRQALVSLGVGLAVLALAAPALALRVHIRIEGARATLFGASEPLTDPVTGSFSPPDGPRLSVGAPSPLGALERASRRGELYYRVRLFSFGPFVDRIGRRAAVGSAGWVYKVNGVLGQVGADQYALERGDRVLWYFARFGPSGGPKTLDVARRRGGCFQALGRSDTGRGSPARDVVFRVDGRTIQSATGLICPDGTWRWLRAFKRGAVRSEVVHRG